MTASKTFLSIAALVVVASGLTPDVQAAPISRATVATAANTCQPAFGPSEAAIRKRPLSVQNEGTTNAFVTCAFVTQAAPTFAVVWVNSFDGAAHTVSCTGVTSYLTGANQYVVKSASVGPAATQNSISWTPADFTPAGGTSFPSTWFSVSCSLPVGSGVNDVQINFPEEIGS